MAAVMLFLQQTTGKTERHTHFCMPLEPVFTRDCGGRVHFTDEPTGALDSKSSVSLLQNFRDLNERAGKTILMVTHSAMAASYASRVLFIKDGEIFAQLYRGEDDNRAFFDRIVANLSVLSDGGADIG